MGNAKAHETSRVRRLAGTALLGAAALILVAGPTAADAPAGRYTFGTGAASGTVYDTKTKLTWQRAVPATQYGWTAAKSTCAGLSLNGAGWRVPTIGELLSIVDFSQPAGPYVDPTAFPGTPADVFWCSTPVAGDSTAAWSVFFDTGFAYGTTRSTPIYVRCVR